MEGNQYVNQKFLDQYFGYNIPKSSYSTSEITPKGIDPLTLKRIEKIVTTSKNGTTAEEMGKKAGVSRTTARRYLEYLISKNKLTAELNYGNIGRPERKYYAVKN